MGMRAETETEIWLVICGLAWVLSRAWTWGTPRVSRRSSCQQSVAHTPAPQLWKKRKEALTSVFSEPWGLQEVDRGVLHKCCATAHRSEG